MNLPSSTRPYGLGRARRAPVKAAHAVQVQVDLQIAHDPRLAAVVGMPPDLEADSRAESHELVGRVLAPLAPLAPLEKVSGRTSTR
ncbi:hypothetical protein ACFVQ3_11075 [Oerskovia sp. NPDC057915]|uniref:hypothetical protein n=1 Tax=Oerskovia sp. NPDC057915 TaxID=3346280 RepID=UPI0036DBFB2A